MATRADARGDKRADQRGDARADQRVDARADRRAGDEQPEHSADFVQSFARGLMVIRSFSAAASQQSLSDVASATGLSRAAARRFLHTLVDLGYAVNADGQFSLTPRVLELGTSYLSALELPSIAQPRLEHLSNQIRESCSLSVLDGTDIIYISRVAVRRIMTVNITIGTRFPAYATSMGRVLLAALDPPALAAHLAAVSPTAFTAHTLHSVPELTAEIDAVRTQGWALVDQELEPGLRSLAAPIVDAHRTPIAAINISTQSASHSVAELKRSFLPPLLETAEDISADLAAAAGG